MFSWLGKPSSVEVRDYSLVPLVDSLTMSLLLVLHMLSNSFSFWAPSESARELLRSANWRHLSEKIEQNSGLLARVYRQVCTMRSSFEFCKASAFCASDAEPLGSVGLLGPRWDSIRRWDESPQPSTKVASVWARSTDRSFSRHSLAWSSYCMRM